MALEVIAGGTPPSGNLREPMIMTAIYLFNRHGYHATSLKDIGDTLGVANTAVYHYFKNKGALLEAACEWSACIFESALDQAAETPGPAVERIVSFIDHMFILVSQRGEFLLERELRGLGEEGFEQALSRFSDQMIRLETLLFEGMEDGSIAPCDPPTTVQMLRGAIASFIGWAHKPEGYTDAFLHEKALDFIRRSLSPVGSTAIAAE
ncbi:MAG: TetR/AcrR family transcriptional regulator [Alphaproteobacteria bacterium]